MPASTTRIPPRLAILIPTGLALAALWLLGGGSRVAEPVSGDRDLCPPTLSDSSYLNARGGADYVGSARCIECHPDQHESYLQTRHSRSFGSVEPDGEPPDAIVDHAASRRRYRIERADGQLWHKESLLLAGGEEVELQLHPLSHWLGSGHFGKAYLSEIDGFLVQSPIAWYATRQQWDLSPGYDFAGHPSFQRLATSECLFCHAGLVETHDRGRLKLSVREAAIGCERCHGPGALHVERRVADAPIPEEVDQTIVHPGRLSRELAEAICQQCHLQGDVHIAVRGRRLDEFRPGLPVEDFRYEFRMTSDQSRLDAVGHVEQLHQSRCYQQSETLTCSTCHNPHHPVAAKQRMAAGRTVCLTCHAPESCGVPPSEREAESRCADCHMPRAATEIPHIAFTDHRIGVHDDTRVHRTDPFQPKLTTVQDLSRLSEIERDRILGLAHWTFYKMNGDEPRFQWCFARAEELLEHIRRRGLQDPAADWARAEMAWIRGYRGKALRLVEGIAREGAADSDERLQALGLLAELRVHQQRFEEAYPLLKELVSRDRGARHWAFFGIAAHERGNADEAIRAFRESLAIDPAQPGIHAALSELYERSGDPESARLHRARAALFEPSTAMGVPLRSSPAAGRKPPSIDQSP